MDHSSVKSELVGGGGGRGFPVSITVLADQSTVTENDRESLNRIRPGIEDMYCELLWDTPSHRVQSCRNWEDPGKQLETSDLWTK
ncbi:hypothetical protein BaRGS_00022807 [Batillaria attramentaria]|uniref:Uncharacterized protein n=1 Tax=Batillaria attramentaria TaxID=370345 RepID=A0ABD0KFV5_9CAEN